MNPAPLSVRVRMERHAGTPATFVLDLTIDIRPGITILFGPSGAGKSTLLDCIAGLLRPDSGHIACGEDVFFDSERNIDLSPRSRRVAYLFQSPALFPHMTVEQNLAYGLSHLDSAGQRTRITEALDAFRVANLRHRKPREISGGEAQRVALARSLVTQPRVLLLDEPLTGLDAALKDAIIDDLRSWNAAHKIPVLYVTHNREELEALGDHVIAIDHGRLEQVGRPREVLDAPRRKKLAEAAGFENVLTGTVLDLRESDGVMRVRLEQSSSEIEVPLGYAVVGQTVNIAIRAGDILLATEQPYGLSARNVLPGEITSLDQRGTIAVARVDSGVPFTVHLTPGAVRSLDLAPGKNVWLVLKTHSCHLVDG